MYKGIIYEFVSPDGDIQSMPHYADLQRSTPTMTSCRGQPQQGAGSPHTIRKSVSQGMCTSSVWALFPEALAGTFFPDVFPFFRLTSLVSSEKAMHMLLKAVWLCWFCAVTFWHIFWHKL